MATQKAAQATAKAAQKAAEMARQAAIAAYKAAVAAAKAIAAAIKAIAAAIKKTDCRHCRRRLGGSRCDSRHLLDRPYRSILFRNLLLF